MLTRGLKSINENILILYLPFVYRTYTDEITRNDNANKDMPVPRIFARAYDSSVDKETVLMT